MAIDLTPFGFTPTESLVYATLLKLGPATGYSVARSAHLARANAYSALEGLTARGAASRTPPPSDLLAIGRPIRRRCSLILQRFRARHSTGWGATCATRRGPASPVHEKSPGAAPWRIS